MSNSTSKLPATLALELSLKPSIPSLVIEKKTVICTKKLKRSRSLLGSFDMSSFLDASLQVEDSIAFPSIEFPEFDDSDDDDLSTQPTPSKRRCRGLVRSNCVSFDLSSLSRRNRSSGSLW